MYWVACPDPIAYDRMLVNLRMQIRESRGVDCHAVCHALRARSFVEFVSGVLGGRDSCVVIGGETILCARYDSVRRVCTLYEVYEAMAEEKTFNYVKSKKMK